MFEEKFLDAILFLCKLCCFLFNYQKIFYKESNVIIQFSLLKIIYSINNIYTIVIN